MVILSNKARPDELSRVGDARWVSEICLSSMLGRGAGALIEGLWSEIVENSNVHAEKKQAITGVTKTARAFSGRLTLGVSSRVGQPSGRKASVRNQATQTKRLSKNVKK